MIFSKKVLVLVSAVFLTALHATAAVDSTFHVYLLFGQSNMAGGGAGVPIGGPAAAVGAMIAADCDTSPRVKVLAFCNCSAGSGAACSQFNTKSRTADVWYTAYPALHICNEGVSPGDWFAKTLLDSIRSDIKIGLVPCALSGQALGVFVKGGSNFNIPNWAHPTLGNSSPYAWMLARCKLAQQTGVIKGILLHQGESGSGSSLSWSATAKNVIDSLKKDLGIDNTVPVVVGELRKDAAACCAGGNTQINLFATQYPNCGLASSTGLGVQSDDPYHFNAQGMRDFGKRYAIAFLSKASAAHVPRKGPVVSACNGRGAHVLVSSPLVEMKVFSLSGRALYTRAGGTSNGAAHAMKAGCGVYLVSQKFKDGRTAIVPIVK